MMVKPLGWEVVWGGKSCPYLLVWRGVKFAEVSLWFWKCDVCALNNNPGLRTEVFRLFKREVVDKSPLWACLLSTRFKGLGSHLRRKLKGLEEGWEDPDTLAIMLHLVIPGCGRLPAFGLGRENYHLYGERDLVEAFLPKLVRLLDGKVPGGKCPRAASEGVGRAAEKHLP